LLVLHPLQHKRAILLASMKELLGLAQEFGDLYDRTQSVVAMGQHRYFTLEAARMGKRLLIVQKEIEDLDLD
jgi:hypothetical protein